MKTSLKRAGLACALGAGALIGGFLILPDGSGPTPSLAQVGTVTFPELEKLIHYTTVRRGVTREHMLTNQTALDAIQTEQGVPTGTHVVLVDYQNDVLTRYLIAEKTGAGAQDWAYQAFNPDQSLREDDESPARCYSCHQSRQDRQFMFTFSDARSFQN